MKINQVLKFLKCPYCHPGRLTLQANPKKLICTKCKIKFDVIDSVPILLKQKHLNQQEKNQLTQFNKHYSKFPNRYKLENWRKSMLKRIFNHHFTKNIKTYLDIGCGATGYTVIETAKKLNCLSFGVDISLEAILKAQNLAKKQRVSQKTAFVVCSAENLPFKKNTFNYVSAISILEHIKNDKKVINNMAKIINKSGYLYICVPNSYKKISPLLWPIFLYIDKKMGHQRHYSIQGLNKILQKNGFSCHKYFYNGHLVKFIQLALEKLKIINRQTWWQMENKDINNNPTGVQLNAIYKKK
ncbi:methyltransferase domain-containing protein [Patescibacteria group bacterium]|nr:methyltransferase domain-containing protein [Patescibacteria group bacterium]